MYFISICCNKISSVIVLAQSFNFIISDCFGKTNSVVITIKNGIELSHKYITYEEHVFLDVHSHDWWCACLISSTHSFLRNWVVSMSLGVRFDLEILLEDRWIIPDFVASSNLYHELWSDWTHTEVHLRTSLSQIWRLSWEHPLIVGLNIVFSTNNKSHITKVFLTIAFY